MNDDIKKDRSPNSPRIQLEDAIGLVEILYKKAGRSSINRELAAKSLGYSGLTGSSLTILGSLNQYRLIDQSKGNVQVSELALQILHPVSTKDWSDSIKTSALSPKLFSEIHQRWHGLEEDVLSNQLVREKFTPESARKVAAVYKANSKLANLDNSEQKLSEISNSPVPKLREAIANTEMLLRQPTAIPMHGGELPIPVSGGHIVRIPFPMSEEDYGLVLETLKLWKKKIVKSEPKEGAQT